MMHFRIHHCWWFLYVITHSQIRDCCGKVYGCSINYVHLLYTINIFAMYKPKLYLSPETICVALNNIDSPECTCMCVRLSWYVFINIANIPWIWRRRFPAIFQFIQDKIGLAGFDGGTAAGQLASRDPHWGHLTCAIRDKQI